MKEEVLRIDNGLVKRHGSPILDSIYLQVFAGETLGIIFDNMDEKDVLLQLLCGEERLTHGRIYLNEELIKGNNAVRLIKKNIFTISGSPLLIPTLSIQENIFFTRFSALFIDSKLYRKKTQELFRYYNINIPVSKPVKQLSNLERVTVELLKAVILGCRLVVISHITGILNNTELETFLRLVSQLKKTGIAFIVIEAFQDIMFEQTDNFLIIRNGKTIGLFNSRMTDRNRIYQLLGKGPANSGDDSAASVGGNTGNPRFDAEEVALRFDNVSGGMLKNISFNLRKGEVLKILYRDNASGDSLIGLLKGTMHPGGGRIYVSGKPYKTSGVRESQERGVCFVEENPTEKMLFKHLSVMYNLCMPLANKVDWFWLKKKYRRSVLKAVTDVIDPIYFRKSLSDLPPSILQKIVYCKWFLYSPSVLVCIKPFSITDIQVNQVTEQMINLLAGKGIAILIVTSNWPTLSTIKGDMLYLENGEPESKQGIK